MFISNSCILLSGWDVESLLQPHRSVPFNPAIANAFYRAGYIETWGRGIQKIYESCKELGVPAPEYSIVGEDITVKFTAHDSIYSDTVNDTVNGTVNLSDFEKDILTAISQNPNYTRKQICDVMAVSLSTVSRTIKKLKDLGYINRVGSDKNGYWEITIK